MKPKPLLRRITRGALANVAFADMRRLLETFGFRLARVSGSHHVFVHPDVPELVNLQNADGQAKPYQIRQILRLIERHDLHPEVRS